MLIVWIIGIFVIMYCFGFRISCFEFRAFSFRKAKPLNSDLPLRTRFSLREYMGHRIYTLPDFEPLNMATHAHTNAKPAKRR